MSSPQIVPTISVRSELVEGDADEMGRARRRLDHDQIARSVDRAHPVAEDGSKTWRRRFTHLVGKRIAELAVTPDLDRADLLEIARDGCLRHGEPEFDQAIRELFLAGERA